MQQRMQGPKAPPNTDPRRVQKEWDPQKIKRMPHLGASCKASPHLQQAGMRTSRGASPHPCPQEAKLRASRGADPLPRGVWLGASHKANPFPHPQGAWLGASREADPLPQEVGLGASREANPLPHPQGAWLGASREADPRPQEELTPPHEQAARERVACSNWGVHVVYVCAMWMCADGAHVCGRHARRATRRGGALNAQKCSWHVLARATKEVPTAQRC